MNFISLGNELKPELEPTSMVPSIDFISLGNELKPELPWIAAVPIVDFISLGNELKPEHVNAPGDTKMRFYIKCA